MSVMSVISVHHCKNARITLVFNSLPLSEDFLLGQCCMWHDSIETQVQ
jgi:hypothetical protein